MLRSVLLLACLVALAGCATRSVLPAMPEDGALEARRWQVQISAHDGTPLALTVWQPELASGESAPLALHTHGIGLSRMKRGVGLYGSILFTGKTAEALWRRGYWLITWDQRGHGDSGDLINMMAPEKEVRDVSTILDWAENNLSRLARENDDPVVAMIGESYGGAVQYLASASDSRIDAIVPVATWYDLDLALAPADIPKGGWLRVLYMITDWWNWRKLPDVLRDGFDGAREGRVPEEAQSWLSGHELQAFCDRGEYPEADALIIQGLRDVLFNPAQGLAARACYRRAGGQSWLVLTRDGHLLPFKQHSSQVPGWNLDDRLHCFEQPRDTRSVVIDWIEARLGRADMPEMPSICVSPGDWGVALSDWPSQGQRFSLAPVRLAGDGSRTRSLWSTPSRWLTPLRSDAAVDKAFSSPRDGGRHPAFIPVYTAGQPEKRVGTPRLDLKGSSAEPVFVSLVVREQGSSALRRVHEQELPVRPGEPVELPPMALRLQPGEQLGLILYSRSEQFPDNVMAFGDDAHFSGTLELPAALPVSGSVATAP